MGQRIAAWLLFLVFAAQLVTLWPLPQDAAAQEIAHWSRLKAEWEARDPSKSETPEWTAKAKSESLSRINEVLADTDNVLYGARIKWGLWLLSALVSAAAAVATLRASRHWRWLVLGSLALFMWLQQPWHSFGLFFPDGQLDLSRGIQQLKFISQYPGPFSVMLLLNVAVPIVLFSVAAYALVQMSGRRRNAL